jgi:plasmid replication initiation protein
VLGVIVQTKTDLVVKSNALVEACYRLDLVEQRIILAAIVTAREEQKGLGDDFITLDAKRFQTTFQMGDNNVYQQLKEAMDTLFNRYVLFRDIHPESGHARVTKVRWISAASYIDGAGTVQLRFAQDIVPFITRLEGEFTQYRLERIGGMSSAHAVRLYEMLVQYLSAGQREIEVAWLKETLQLGEDYSRLFDFKKWVVDVAVKQINEHSDIRVSYTQRKTGRIVTHLIFTIKTADKPSTTKLKNPTVNRTYVEQHARPGESYDDAYRRLLEEAGQQRLCV